MAKEAEFLSLGCKLCGGRTALVVAVCEKGVLLQCDSCGEQVARIARDRLPEFIDKVIAKGCAGCGGEGCKHAAPTAGVVEPREHRPIEDGELFKQSWQGGDRK